MKSLLRTDKIHPHSATYGWNFKRGWDSTDSKIIVKDAAYSEWKKYKFLDSILTKGQDNNDSNEAENI